MNFSPSHSIHRWTILLSSQNATQVKVALLVNYEIFSQRKCSGFLRCHYVVTFNKSWKENDAPSTHLKLKSSTNVWNVLVWHLKIDKTSLDCRGGCTWRMYVEDVRRGCMWRMYVEDVRGGCTWRMYVEDVRGGCTWHCSVDATRGNQSVDFTQHTIAMS